MEKEIDSRIYELAYILVPTLEETQAMARFGDMKALLADTGAQILTEDIPRLIELAYEMNRTIENKKTWFDTGYFGWVKFEIDPALIASIEEKLSRDETVIRYMIIKTVRENTVISKKPLGMKRRTDQKEDEDTVVNMEAVLTDESTAPVAPATPEELDKQIDALITE